MQSTEEKIAAAKQTASDLETSLATISSLEAQVAALKAAGERAIKENDTLRRSNDELFADNDRLREENRTVIKENDDLHARESAWLHDRDSFLRHRAEVNVQITNAEMSLADARQRINQGELGEPMVPIDFRPTLDEEERYKQLTAIRQIANTVPTQ